MDAVNVHIAVKDEASPRQYIITGGTFDAMKAAIKATGARYDGNRRSWALPGPNAFDLLKQLRQQYTVAEMAILRLQRDFDQAYRDVDRDSVANTLNWQNATWTVQTTLCLEVQIRQDQGGYSEWRRLPPVPIAVEITPSAAAAQAAVMTPENHWQPTQVHGISIARGIVRDELDRRADAANERLLELLRGKTRTKENIIKAVKALFTELGFSEAQ